MGDEHGEHEHDDFSIARVASPVVNRNPAHRYWDAAKDQQFFDPAHAVIVGFLTVSSEGMDRA